MEGTLVLLRHGQSQGNADEIFTGLLDVPLTDLGLAEVGGAAAQLRFAGLRPDRWCVSPMLRTRQSAQALAELIGPPPALEWDWRLAERNYGALSGRTKSAVREEFGEELFRTWRRSLDVAPPPATPEQARAFAGPDDLGLTESLADVVVRVGQAWRESILPGLTDAGTLVIAHGNSLRALCTVLDDLDEAQVRALNLPTGFPLVYRIGPDGVPLVRGGTYLSEDAHAAADLVARQGGT